MLCICDLYFIISFICNWCFFQGKKSGKGKAHLGCSGSCSGSEAEAQVVRARKEDKSEWLVGG